MFTGTVVEHCAVLPVCERTVSTKVRVWVIPETVREPFTDTAPTELKSADTALVEDQVRVAISGPSSPHSWCLLL